MKQENIDKLNSKYSFLDNIPIDCDDGWYDILDSACKAIHFRILLLDKKDFKAFQIKNKFGRLRFYMNKEDDYINGVLDCLENVSAHTCEICGNSATIINIGGFITARCKEHNNR